MAWYELTSIIIIPHPGVSPKNEKSFYILWWSLIFPVVRTCFLLFVFLFLQRVPCDCSSIIYDFLFFVYRSFLITRRWKQLRSHYLQFLLVLPCFQFIRHLKVENCNIYFRRGGSMSVCRRLSIKCRRQFHPPRARTCAAGTCRGSIRPKRLYFEFRPASSSP